MGPVQSRGLCNCLGRISVSRGGSPLMAYSAASNAAHLGLELMHGFLHSQTKAARELKQATYGDSLSRSTSEGPAFEIRK